MILLVDIGNTRIKWAMLARDGLGVQHAAPYADWNPAALDANILAQLSKPERILVANVGGEAIGRIFIEASRTKWSMTPEFIHSTAHDCGVRNSYPHPEQLGVDRWVGMIAAFQMRLGPTCIASVGTALTVDGITADGMHLGGIIVPGPDLAIASLLRNTSDLSTRSQSGAIRSELLADNTLGAIHQGVVHMLAAVVEKAMVDIHRQVGRVPALVVTGGASDRLPPLVRIADRVVPELVLQGLAAMARR